MAAPDLTICNLALQQVPSAKIASLSENSLAATECSTAYPQVLGEMLEQHPWRFARRRETLAVVTNDRTCEWANAFAMPKDVASVIGLRIDPNAQSNGRVWQGGCGFEVADGVLYSNLPGAILEYTSSAVQSAQFPMGFRNALAMALASRVVMPILKSRERQADLLKAASTAWNRAVADDLDQAPASMDHFMPYEARARYAEWGGGLGYDPETGWRP